MAIVLCIKQNYNIRQKNHQGPLYCTLLKIFVITQGTILESVPSELRDNTLYDTTRVIAKVRDATKRTTYKILSKSVIKLSLFLNKG